jgi:hypothetical protein
MNQFINFLIQPSSQGFNDYKKAFNHIFERLDVPLIIQRIEDNILRSIKSNAKVDMQKEGVDHWLKKLESEQQIEQSKAA